MKRCRHKNVVLKETVAGTYEWTVEDGLVIGEGYKYEYLTGGVAIKCKDCNRFFVFGPCAACPNWVNRLRDQIAER